MSECSVLHTLPQSLRGLCGRRGCGNTKKHITDELEYNKRAHYAKERRTWASAISTPPRLGNKSRSPQQGAYL